jgi:hypothetical protein
MHPPACPRRPAKRGGNGSPCSIGQALACP